MDLVKDGALRLLIVDDSVEAAEAIVSGLRNNGIAVRPSRPETEAELAELLNDKTFELVLAARDASGVSLSGLMHLVKSSGKDLPALLVVDSVDNACLLEALALGARGVVLRGRMEHIQSTVRAEWTDLVARRQLRRLEAQVRDSDRRCDSLIDSSRDPIAYVHEGMHIRANAAYLEMFGYDSFEEIEGMSLLDMIAPQHVEGFKKLLKQMSKGEPPPPRYEVEARTMDGTAFPAVMEFAPATYEGENCLQLVLRRQEQEFDPELAREVEELRQRDQVTGLLNRATFLRALEDSVSESALKSTPHGLLLIEPDHYTRLLQEIGLDAADELAAAVAARLRQSLGPDDVAARFGEHQFAVLSRNTDHAATSRLAETLRASFADAVLETENRSLNTTVSIGGVQIGERIASVTAVLAKASQGLRSMVGVGGNRVELFDPGAVDRAEEERVAAWVARIREALEADRFLMHFQPLISLQGDPGEIYEAYLRLHGEHGELVQPLTFLQIAEEHGLLWEIDRWVVGRAIAIIGERLKAGHRTTLLVKITPVSLQDDGLVRYIQEQLVKHGADGSLLVVQLPESKVFTNLRPAQEFLAKVGAMGVRMGLEQFGAGLNSFQLLSHFDASFLKIDRSFLEELSTSAEHQARIRTIAAEANKLGKLTIADHVQDPSSMTVLFSAGIGYAQGHFLAMAGPELNHEFE